ncbi:hypothetical protein QR680_017237 [Steinernema hermaphroditum]|uniref:UBA domain-containing protein n=1 Tax=Steinernema hermaphroditum TaxID=289476 RepID=A0AA39HG88_9BILA|nr:hypothetical protein QR680_017237 [Steinernema hermaphroditum]
MKSDFFHYRFLSTPPSVMIITFMAGEDMSSTDVSPQMEIENLLALIQVELPILAQFAVDKLHLVHNGTKYATGTILKKTIEEMAFQDGDLIYVMPMPKELAKPTGSGPGPLPQAKAQRVSQLISSIKFKDEALYRENMVSLFSRLNDPTKEHIREYMRTESKAIYDAWEKNPTDFEAFYKECLVYRLEDVRRAQLAMTDPTSAEGQKYIADMIRKQNIEHTENFAKEHMPENKGSRCLLYVKLNINGCEVQAFIDSGAQISLMSEHCAKRCNLERLIDYRYKGRASGIGGEARFLGKLHSVEVKTSNDHKFPCMFEVNRDRKVDLLIGLDLLKRHHCVIDLGKMILRFGDGTEVPFLEDKEVERYMVSIGLIDDLIDTDRLAELVELGFDSREAAQELLACDNDVLMASASLFARREEKKKAEGEGGGTPMDQ